MKLAPKQDQPAGEREVRFEYTRDFPGILEHLGVSLAVSTYQAGKLAAIGTWNGQLTFGFHSFDRVAGLAASDQCLAVGGRRQVHLLHARHELAAGLPPRGTHDACWLARTSLVTGDIQGHEMAWGLDGLWVVNTLFSALCTLREGYSFVPCWCPPFVSDLVAEDRCHLTGLAMQDGRPRYVTAHGESNEHAGWRPTQATGGCVIDVLSGETVVRGLCMPHSPRIRDGQLWVLDSGTGGLNQIDIAAGRAIPVERLPGYTRGLSILGQFAFVGLSRIRETSVFGGAPIAEDRDQLRCGVAVVDLASGRAVAWVQFHTVVDEIFAVEVLPGCRNPVLSGPSADDDGHGEIWVVPPRQSGERSQSGDWSLESGGGSRFPHGPLSTGVLDGGEAKGEGACHVRPALTSSHSLRNVDRLREAVEALRAEGRFAEALAQCRQAVELAPHRADLWNALGNLQQEINDQSAAMTSYERAVESQPNFVAAHQNLGYLLFNHGEPERALDHYRKAEAIESSPITRVLTATVLPVVYESRDDVARWRTRYEGAVRTLADEGVRIDTLRMMLPTSFFLAYQGENNREPARNLGRIFQGVSHCAPSQVRAHGAKVKVGFLSAYFRDHTIGRLNLGRIQHLSRDRFDVSAIFAGQPADEMTREFAAAADRFVHIPRDVQSARQRISDLGLDILVFTDVGMDALTYTLAFSRMAPVQCATWGHPDTTGSPTMDYFISSELTEAPDADQHYTERLVRLPNLGTFYRRPTVTGPQRSREFFGLAGDRHIYLCPQTVFKFHPAFDEVLCGILRADPRGEVVVMDGRVPHWTDRLKRRFARTLGADAERVRFVPPQPNADFLQLLSLADVMLDPFPFGGGNTSYEAFAMGVPVVTWPGRFLRGRITLALYHRMGIDDCVAESPDDYVRCATRLASDEHHRELVRARIRNSSGVLFENLEDVRVLEEFLVRAVNEPVGERDPPLREPGSHLERRQPATTPS